MADQEASTADAVEEPMEGVEEAEKPSGSEAENVNNAKSENADSTSDEDAKKGDEDAKKGENADITSDGDAKKDENEVALAAPVYEDDGGAASEAEFEAEDDRFTLTDYTDEVSKWPWHIEVYPVDTEDLLLDNFNKICLTASYSQIVFRTNSNGEKVGEVHLYAEDAFKARGIMRVLLWRKLKKLKPFVYIYRRKEEGTDEYETAFLRLNVIESSKMRRQELRKESKAEARLRLAKVTNVPLDTSKDMLNVIFARVSQMKRHTDKSDEEAKDSEMQTESEKQTEGSESEAKAESAEKMPESAEKMPESTEKTAESTEEKTESTEKQSDKPESKTDGEKNKEDISDDKGGLPEESDELDGDFNGTVTLDFFGKTSLRGFLLGYPKVVIGENQVEIKPISEELNIETLKRESRQRRREALQRKNEPKSPAREHWHRDSRHSTDSRSGDRSRGRGGGGFGRGGGRGGRGGGDRGGWGRGGGMMKTGRERFEEKSQRRGGGGGDRGGYRGRGGWGGGQDYRPRGQSHYARSRYEGGGRDEGYWGQPGSSRGGGGRYSGGWRGRQY